MCPDHANSVTQSFSETSLVSLQVSFLSPCMLSCLRDMRREIFFYSEMELLWSVKDTSLLLVLLFTSIVQ